MSLNAYRRKRDFERSPEPSGDKSRSTPQPRFVVQKHAATQLHYDFRLELGGTLKSWAVPKGIPQAKGEKRLAVEVEDHPVDYANFEGTIPEGEYGGGTVMIWDAGTYEARDPAPLKSLRAGKLHFTLSGHKLRGEWYLVRLKEDRQWLLIKGGTSLRPISKARDDQSVVSGKTMAELGNSRPPRKAKHRPARKSKLLPARAARRRPTREARVQAVRAVRAVRNRRAPADRAPGPGTGPHFFPPMLARSSTVIPEGDWCYELKFDGYRAQLIKNGESVQLLSRNENRLDGRFAEVTAAAARLKAEQAVIDGEIVAMDADGRSSFQLLQAEAAEAAEISGGAKAFIRYFAFDLLHLDGEDWRGFPLTERKARLEAILPRRSVIRFSPSLGCDGRALLAQVQRQGLEGLIGKRPDSVYESGRRTGAWVKLKATREQEVVIGGYTAPEGGRQHFGALLVGVYEGQRLRFAGKVGTGFSDKRLALLKARLEPLVRNTCPFAHLPEASVGRHGQGLTRAAMKRCTWASPRLVAQVKFHEWTRDGKLRQPVFLGLREDKPAREVVQET